MRKQLAAWWKQASFERKPGTLLATAIFFLLFLTVLWARLSQARWGLPYVGEIDEKPIVDVVRTILTTGNYNPHFFSYGSLSIYLSLVAAIGAYLNGMSQGAIATLDEFTRVSYDTLVLTSPNLLGGPRLLFALLNTVTLIPTFLVARRLRGSWAGLTATVVLASSFIATYYAIRVNVDGLATLWVAWSAWVALELLETERPRRWAVIGGILVGLAAGSKYTQGLVIVMPAIALLLRVQPCPRGQSLVLLGGVAGLTFLLTTPYALLALPEFLRDVGTEAAHYAVVGHPGYDGTTGWPQVVFHLRFIVSSQGVGPLASLLALVGFVVTLGSRPRSALTLVSFILLLVFYFSQQRVHFFRNLLPIYPLLAVFAGVAVAWAGAVIYQRLARRWGPRWVGWATGLIWTFLLLLGLEVRFVAAYSYAQSQYLPTQVQTVRWLVDHVGPGDKVAIPSEVPWSPQGLADVPFTVVFYSARAPGLGALAEQGVRWIVAPTFEASEDAGSGPSFGSELAYLAPQITFGELPLEPGRRLTSA